MELVLVIVMILVQALKPLGLIVQPEIKHSVDVVIVQ
jgi:hypothetical protein